MSNNSKKLNKSVSFSRYDSIPWPRWSDNDLNSEQWNDSSESFTRFNDNSQPVELPLSLQPHTWKRPHEIKNMKPIICSSSSPKNHPNLFINNKHLLNSEFMRWFISSVTILSYYGREGLEVTTSPGFSWNFRDKPWHGSLYIYCMNKAGLGAQHDPQINPHGRYIVRLFFMGCWRRVEINDLIPFDVEGRSLLPHAENFEELWSVLLAKAMMKIAALSWTSHSELNDFNPIVCLTGWTCMSLNISHLSPNDRWELVAKYCEIRKLPNTSDEQSVALIKKENNTMKQKKHSKKHETRRLGKGKVEKKNDFPVVTFLCISNETKDYAEVPHGIVPTYPAYVESSCNTSNSEVIRQPLESWKLHRWLPWAMRQGIIDPADYYIPTRRIFLYNPSNVELINKGKKLSSIWLDFNKLSDYAMNIFFFFKLEHFKCSIDVADVLPDELHEDKKKKSNNVSRIKIKKLKEGEFDDTARTKNNYEYNHIGFQSRNEALYLFIDSIHSKFLLFNFSTLPEPDRNSSLIIERHCWFNRPLESKALLEIKTVATKSKALCLEPGRHLLRIFCHSKNSYHLTISSDTNFHVGDRRQMHKLMQSESERMKLLANKIKNAMSELFSSFGSQNYQDNLKNYYRSYMPERMNNGLEIRSYKLIHDYFNGELIELIMKKCDVSVLEALKIFFCNPEISKTTESFNHNNPLNSGPTPSMEDIDEEFGEEKQDYHHNLLIVNSAKIIQSHWRMARVKLYKKIHDAKHKRHKFVQQILRQILSDVIYLNAICSIIRNVIKRDEKLANCYPCTNDFEKILEVQEIKGILSSISPHQWIPIVHLTINVPNDSIAFACVDLFVDLPAYILQVFNNDTGRELQRIVNNVIPFHYQRKNKGYTIIGYGWSHNKMIKELEWSLHLTTIKGDPQLILFNEDKPISSLVEIAPLRIHELSNVYIPNVHNLIFKAILNTHGSCWISLRVHTTYKKVQMKLRVKDNDGKTVTEVFGGATIILPIVYLDIDKTQWIIIEAMVLPKSWPLTADEWNAVTKSKQTIDQSNVETESMVSIGNTSKSRESSEHFFETPRWYLQVVSDDGIHLELHEDTSRDEEIQKIKESWNLNGPNRMNRGKKIRDNFLRDNYYDELLHEEERLIHEEIRTLKPPQQQKISSLSFTKFFVDNENRRLKTDSDEELQRAVREQTISEFEEANTSFTERSSNLLRELQLNVALSSRIPTKRNA